MTSVATRVLSALVLVTFLSFLVACGASVAPLGISLSAPNSAIDQAQTVNISASVKNDSKTAGVTWTLSGSGSLTNRTTSSVTYMAPASVTQAFTANITATSVSDTTKTAIVQITVNPLPTITTASPLPASTAGTPYTVTLAASGGSSPMTWNAGSGLPNGLSLSSSTGVISGMPTGPVGNAHFTVTLTDNTKASTQLQAMLPVNAPPPLTIMPSSLPGGTVGTAYNQTLQATGGVPTYKWSISSGSLPAGLSLNASTGSITGTPTGPQTGTINFTVAVTDSATPQATTQTANLSIVVTAPPLNVTTSSLSGGTLGTAYSQTLAATGGITPYAWSISAGSLPAGLTLNASTGMISGTPTGNVTGLINFTVKVTDSETPTAQSSPKALSITITAPPLSVTSSSLPAGVVNSSYSATLQATGGVTPYSWSITTGSLPAGLTLNAGTGVISGTPTGSGSTFTATVTDAETPTAQTANKQFTITVNPQLTVTTSSLPAATVGTAYNQTLAATGGITPYTWAVTTGSLPAGLMLNSSTGAITGTPTGPQTGTIAFTVTVTDSENPVKTASANLSITVSAPPLSVTTQSLPNGTLGTTYSTTLAATGGITPYAWSISAGALPAGLTLNSSTGAITGTPTGSVTGQIKFTVKVTDAETPTPATATAALSITISAAPLSVVTTSLPAGVVGSGYSATLQAAGGVAPYTWSVTTGSLPGGLTLAASTGVISGTPTGSSSTFTVTVTDSETPTPQTATKQLTITINPQLAISTASLANGIINTAYNQTLSATGGITPYTWTLQSGSLPSGLTLSASGVISGTATASGTSSFTVKVTDAESPAAQSATANLSITIYAKLVVQTSNPLPVAVVNVAYSGVTLQAAGGLAPYTWSLTGNLPPGLTLNGSTGAITGTPTSTGTYNFTVKATDSGNPQQTASANLSIVVNPALAITTAQLPAGVINQPYNQTLSATGGITPYTWSLSAGTLPAGLSLGSNGAITGTPTATGTSSFTAKVTDSESPAQSVTANLSITINNSAPLQITTPTGALTPGVINIVYAGFTLQASGGTLPYAWSYTGSLPPGLTLNAGSGLISGTPTATGTFNFTAKVTDSSSPQQSQTSNFSITINSALAITTTSLPGGSINSQYNQSVNATGGLQPYTWAIISGNLPPGLTPNSNNTSLNISGQPTSTGSYTFTAQVTDSESSTASNSYTVVIGNQPAGFTVSGTVSYTGAKTGQIYLQLVPTSCTNGCNNGLGTSTTVSSGGAFTIHGVLAGTYTLQAFMDNIGYGAENASNPTGSVSNIMVVSSNVGGVSLALSDPSTVSLNGLAPSWKGNGGSGAFNGGALVSFQTIKNNNGIEMPASYTIQWSTSSSFGSIAGSTSFPATGHGDPWIISGLTNGTTYYFRAQGVAGSSTSNWSAASPAFTIGAPTGGNTISGTVTFSGTAKGPLYVGFYDQNTGNVYADAVGSKSSPPKSPAAYTVQVPNGSNYYFFGVIDNNNSGLIGGPGQVSNTNSPGNSPPVVISGPMSNENLTLSSANSQAIVTTNNFEQVGGSNGYSIGFSLVGLFKLPVAVEVATGPTPGAVLPADIANNAFYGGHDEYSYYTSLNGATPQVGDTYTLNVTYSDGTSEVLNVQVTAVLNAFATNMSPQGSGVSVTPNFSWTDPSNASNYKYQFSLCCDQNNNTIWQIPGNNSNSNGFSSNITSITWDVDPTGSGDLPDMSSLNGGTTYYWQITASDINGNSAQVQASFTTAAATLTLPPSGSAGTAVVAQNFNGAINASGGVGPYTFTVNGSPVPTNGTQVSLGDNLFASNTGGNTLSLSGMPTSSGTVSFTVSVTDSMSNTAGPNTYSITVNNASALQIQSSKLPEASESTAYSTALNANGGVQPYTWSVSSGNLPPGLSLNASTGAITGTPTATGTYNFSVTVTDATATQATASLSILVITCSNNSSFTGNWAMLLEGWNTANSGPGVNVQLASVGSFLANGSGQIASGSIDTNDQLNGPQSGTITGGAYCIASNNTGLMTLTFGSPYNTSHTYAIALNTSYTNGRIIYYENSTLMASGPLRKQTTSAFSTSKISGDYAFGLIGADGGGPAAVSRFGMAGEFNSNGSGKLNGMVDADADGTPYPQVTMSATNFSVLSSTTGRGTVSVSYTGQGTLNYVFYVVSATELLMMETDNAAQTGGNPLLAGHVLAQTGGGSFTDSSLNGTIILGVQGIDNSGTQPAGSVSAGFITAQGNGNASISLDQNDAGTEGTLAASGTYSVASNGRIALSGFGKNSPVMYLASANQGFMVGTDNSVIYGQFYAQTGSSFSNSSINGTFTGGSDHPEDASSGSEVDSINGNGAGTFNGASLNDGGGSPNYNSISATYSVSSNGRVTVSQGGNQVGIIYIVNSSTLLFMPVGGSQNGNNDPTIDWFEQ